MATYVGIALAVLIIAALLALDRSRPTASAIDEEGGPGPHSLLSTSSSTTGPAPASGRGHQVGRRPEDAARGGRPQDPPPGEHLAVLDRPDDGETLVTVAPEEQLPRGGVAPTATRWGVTQRNGAAAVSHNPAGPGDRPSR